ncbi:uncharacterized protein C16orf52 homolog A isoform X2 [Nematostella vectensis]|uniref:uncharacterized protein C16orf52 homolog A isoform X2 n=1 Tax=Nematostella vectensis TaxID=45351 RepID=UPI00138FD127|nr:uncharacterized protein C16orf52 homolog A isoform X2 [Nematostella vectensis]
MDKSVIAGGILCFIADVFAIASIATPEWIVNQFAGSMRLGLTMTCHQPLTQPEVCASTEQPSEWLVTTGLINIGIVLLSMAWLFLLFSARQRHLVKFGRWFIFTALILFNLAALVFPLGFHMPEIGGMPFKLPNGTNVGHSFILFVFSIILTVTSEMFLFKVCPLFIR